MRALFCSLTAPGLLFSSIGVALALKKNGHRVAFTTHPDAAGWLQQAGLERIPRGVPDGPSFQVEIWGNALSIAMQVKHLEAAIERFQPDVLVGQQLTFGAFLAAERQHLPVAVLGLAAYLWPVSDAPLERPAEAERERRLARRYREMMQTYNEARALFRLSPSEAGVRSTPLLGDLFLLQSTAELERAVENLPERVRLVGPCLWEPAEADPELERWLAEAPGEPLIYLHEGRLFGRSSLWPLAVAALGDRPVRVAASTWRMDPSPRDVPQNFFTRAFVAQAPVLRRACAAIASANSTVVLGALLQGVPLLLSAGGGEQKEVAERCLEAGVAIGLEPEKANAAHFAHFLDRVREDAGLRRRAEQIRRALQAEGGCGSAAHLIEQLVIGSGSVLRRAHLEGSVP